jgi:hypothetical protein
MSDLIAQLEDLANRNPKLAESFAQGMGKTLKSSLEEFAQENAKRVNDALEAQKAQMRFVTGGYAGGLAVILAIFGSFIGNEKSNAPISIFIIIILFIIGLGFCWWHTELSVKISLLKFEAGLDARIKRLSIKQGVSSPTGVAEGAQSSESKLLRATATQHMIRRLASKWLVFSVGSALVAILNFIDLSWAPGLGNFLRNIFGQT